MRRSARLELKRIRDESIDQSELSVRPSKKRKVTARASRVKSSRVTFTASSVEKQQSVVYSAQSLRQRTTLLSLPLEIRHIIFEFHLENQADVVLQRQMRDYDQYRDLSRPVLYDLSSARGRSCIRMRIRAFRTGEKYSYDIETLSPPGPLRMINKQLRQELQHFCNSTLHMDFARYPYDMRHVDRWILRNGPTAFHNIHTVHVDFAKYHQIQDRKFYLDVRVKVVFPISIEVVTTPDYMYNLLVKDAESRSQFASLLTEMTQRFQKRLQKANERRLDYAHPDLVLAILDGVAMEKGL